MECLIGTLQHGEAMSTPVLQESGDILSLCNTPAIRYAGQKPPGRCKRQQAKQILDFFLRHERQSSDGGLNAPDCGLDGIWLGGENGTVEHDGHDGCECFLCLTCENESGWGGLCPCGTIHAARRGKYNGAE